MGRDAQEKRSRFFGIDRAVLAIVKIAGSALLVVDSKISVLRRKGTVFAAVSLLVPLSALIVLSTNSAQAATSETLNFQGRLLTNTGGLIPDGTYNVEFNLYNVASGGSTLWTEDRLNTNTQGVTVRNGYFSVYLGEYDAFGVIDWDQDLWLGMTIRGADNCAWGSCTPTDNEMTPRFKLSAVPYAFRAANVASSSTNSASTNSSDVSISTGNALGVTSNSGNITIDAGTATGTAGQISIGSTNASSVLLGRSGVDTSVQGTLSADELSTFDGNIRISDGSSNYATIDVEALAGDYTVSIPTITGNDTFCLESLANCGGGGLSATLADNTADAWDIQEGTNNYINIDTTDSSEAISFGNATTNPDFNVLGSGNFTANSDTVVFRNTNDSTSSFQVQNAVGTSILSVDTTNSALQVIDDGYINFGATTGSSGYGFRDSGGVLEVKDENGCWIAIIGGGCTTAGPTPVLESYTTYVDGISTEHELEIPTGTVNGDLLVAFVDTQESGTTVSTPSGWTALDSTIDSGGYEVRTSVFYRIADGDTPGSTVTFTHASANYNTGAMLRISGADTSTPFDVYDSRTRDDDVQVGYPAVTTTTTNTLGIGYAMAWEETHGSTSINNWNLETGFHSDYGRIDTRDFDTATTYGAEECSCNENDNYVSYVLAINANSSAVFGNANRQLSNLANVQINTDLTPDTSNAYDLGSPTATWRDLYLGGDLVVSDASGYSVTIDTATLTDNATYRFADATAGTYEICTSAGNCGTGGTGFFLNNGNNFGQTAVLGTNDAYNLELEVAGNTVLTLDNTDGSATFQNSTDSTAAFQIQDAAGTSNLFIADTTNNRVGIGVTSGPGKLTVYDDSTVNYSEATSATITREQYAVGCCSNGTESATFGATPTPGNLLVAVVGHRGDPASAFISESGWTKVFDNQYWTSTSDRRTVSMFYKIAGAAEGSTVTAGWYGTGSPNSNHMIIQEFSTDQGTFVFDTYATATSAGSSVSSLSSGTTATSEQDHSLLITATIHRGEPGAASWTNGLGNNIYSTQGGSDNSSVQSAWSQDSTQSAKESTASWSTSVMTNTGIAVFSLVDVTADDLVVIDRENESIGTNLLRVTSNGNDYFTISDEGVVSVAASSHFTDNVLLGTDSLFYDFATGNIGIGTLTPGNPLSVGSLATSGAETEDASLIVAAGGVNNDKGVIIQNTGGSSDLFVLQNSSGFDMAGFDGSGNLFWYDSSGDKLEIERASSLTTDRTLLLPNADGTILLNSTGFAQGGNSFTAAAVLGTNNAYDLQLRAGGSNLLTLENSTGNIRVGASNTTGTLLVLDTKTNSGDPTGVNGAMYYNSNYGTFRCYENNEWRNCIGGLVFANTSVPAGNTISNTTSETNFASNYTIPANDCQPGRVYRVTARGSYETIGSPGTAEVKLKAGSNDLHEIAAGSWIPGSAPDYAWEMHYDIICVASGASGEVEAQGSGTFDASSATHISTANTSTITLNTTSSQTLQMSFQWGTADAGNSITLRQFIVEAL